MNNLSKYKMFKRIDKVFDFVIKILWFVLLCKWLIGDLNITSLIK